MTKKIIQIEMFEIERGREPQRQSPEEAVSPHSRGWSDPDTIHECWLPTNAGKR